jgi:hypothetical protein
VTSKKDHGDMDRFVWAADNIKIHRKNIKVPEPKKKPKPDQLPSSKDPQSKKAPKGGAT